MTADLVCTPSTTRTDQPPREYLTRRQSADYIREELGRPMSFSTASKLAALGEFAAPAMWWGETSALHTRRLACLGGGPQPTDEAARRERSCSRKLSIEPVA
jgi:hypothetical protein